MRLTDAQWLEIRPVLTQPTRSSQGGRPRTDDRQVINGILWILLNGTQWAEIPDSYGSYVTCWRRYSEWLKKGTWDKIWTVLVKIMDRKQQLEWSMALCDGTFLPVKKASGK